MNQFDPKLLSRFISLSESISDMNDIVENMLVKNIEIEQDEFDIVVKIPTINDKGEITNSLIFWKALWKRLFTEYEIPFISGKSMKAMIERVRFPPTYNKKHRVQRTKENGGTFTVVSKTNVVWNRMDYTTKIRKIGILTY